MPKVELGKQRVGWDCCVMKRQIRYMQCKHITLNLGWGKVKWGIQVGVQPRGATAIERWTPCSFKKTCKIKKGRFSRTGDVRAYSGKGIKIAEIWKKGYTFQQLRYAFRVYILLIMKRDENTHFDTRLGYIFYSSWKYTCLGWGKHDKILV